jgi:SAM-dependent methyltransferase
MTDLSSSRFDPLGRFTGLAGDYARHRPEYPEAALAFIMTRAGLTSQAVVVDVGAGTGISARLFARRGLTVIGIEPNDDMRRRAEMEPFDGGQPPTYRPGRAEATGLPNGIADLVLSAQAFHWFEPVATLAEFRRILKPHGWVTLMWYERDDGDEATAALSAVFATVPDAARVEGPRQQAGAALLKSPLFEAGEQRSFAHAQPLDRDGLLGRAFSASYSPREPQAAASFAAALNDVFDRHQQGGLFTLCYETTVYLGRRR